MTEKTVNINPDFFSISSKRKKRGSGEEGERTPRLRPQVDKTKQLTHTLKQSIIKMMRKHNHNKYLQDMKQGGSTSTTEDDIAHIVSGGDPNYPTSTADVEGEDAEFNQSIEFLTNLSDNVRTKSQQATLGHTQQLVLTNTPNAVPLLRPPHQQQSQDNPQPVHKVTTINDGAMYNRLGVTPMYGVLKRGTLPTYRSWFNRTKRGTGGAGQGTGGTGLGTNTPRAVFAPKRPELPMTEEQRSYRQQLENNIKQASLAKQMTRINELYRESASSSGGETESNTQNTNNPAQPVKKKYIPIQKRTIRRIFQVGKHTDKPSITLLLSNRTIRANTILAGQKAKQSHIRDVRKFLIRRKLILPGTDVPNDILRSLYENANLLVGEINDL